MALFLILVAAFGLLITGYWSWIVWLNWVTFPPAKAEWFLIDAMMRAALWALLGAGAALQWRRPRLGRLMLLLWSLLHLIWLPISAVVALGLMEPPPEYVVALVMSAMVARVAFPPTALIVVVVLSMWLLGPIVVLTWLWRSGRKKLKLPSG